MCSLRNQSAQKTKQHFCFVIEHLLVKIEADRFVIPFRVFVAFPSNSREMRRKYLKSDVNRCLPHFIQFQIPGFRGGNRSYYGILGFDITKVCRWIQTDLSLELAVFCKVLNL